jgi:hypothetical protein
VCVPDRKAQHLHGGVLLIDEGAVKGAVIENHAEPLRVQIPGIGHLHLQLRAAQGPGGNHHPCDNRQE